MVSMVLFVVLLSPGLLVEGEGVGERTLIPLLVSSQTTSSQNCWSGQEGEEGKLQESHLVEACRCSKLKHEHCQAHTERGLPLEVFIGRAATGCKRRETVDQTYNFEKVALPLCPLLRR